MEANVSVLVLVTKHGNDSSTNGCDSNGAQSIKMVLATTTHCATGKSRRIESSRVKPAMFVYTEEEDIETSRQTR